MTFTQMLDAVRRRLWAGPPVGLPRIVAVGAVSALLILGLRSSAPITGEAADSSFDAAYFRGLLAREGPWGIVQRLYVMPPDVATPLFSGIGSGETEWLEVYGPLRRGAPAEVTRNELDYAFVRALEKKPETVLAYLRAHPDLPASEICRRVNLSDRDPEVPDAREMLGIIRRQKGLAQVTNSELKGIRSTCLAAVTQMVRRQLRAYLVSHGAADSTSRAAARLSRPEQRELESVIAAAKEDGTLTARLDGLFPDGPFRLRDVPAAVSSICADDAGRIANPEGPWEGTDSISDERLPRARLLSACRVDREEWDLTCERGGFGPVVRHLRVRRSGDRWDVIQQEPDPSRNGEERAFDPWRDCRSIMSRGRGDSSSEPVAVKR